MQDIVAVGIVKRLGRLPAQLGHIARQAVAITDAILCDDLGQVSAIDQCMAKYGTPRSVP